MGISGTTPGTLRGNSKLTSSDFPIEGRIIQETDLPLALRNEHKQHEAYRLRGQVDSLGKVRDVADKRREWAKAAIARIGVPPELRQAYAEETPAAASEDLRPGVPTEPSGAPATSHVTQSRRQGEEDPMIMMILKQLEKLSDRVERMEIRGNMAQQEPSTRGAPPEERGRSSSHFPQDAPPERPGEGNAKGKGGEKGGDPPLGHRSADTPPLSMRGRLKQRDDLEGVARQGLARGREKT